MYGDPGKCDHNKSIYMVIPSLKSDVIGLLRVVADRFTEMDKPFRQRNSSLGRTEFEGNVYQRIVKKLIGKNKSWTVMGITGNIRLFFIKGGDYLIKMTNVYLFSMKYLAFISTTMLYVIGFETK